LQGDEYHVPPAVGGRRQVYENAEHHVHEGGDAGVREPSSSSSSSSWPAASQPGKLTV